jgi:hypothetical protein
MAQVQKGSFDSSPTPRESKRGYLRSLFSPFSSKPRKTLRSSEAEPSQKSPSRSNPHESAEWTERLWQQAREEVSELMDTKKKTEEPPRKQTQKDKIQSMQEDLLKLVKDAEAKGQIKITRNPSARRNSDVMAFKMKEMQQDLLDLVREAEQCGQVKILRRRSTELISMPGHGKVRLVPHRTKDQQGTR